MRRLAIFWLACAVVGFLAAIGAACMLSLAVDGAASWRGAPTERQVAQRRAGQPSNGAAAESPAMVTPALNRAGGE